jgi:predicted nucleic acid-binding protein
MAIGSFLPETLLVLDNDSLTHWRNKQPYIENEISSYIARHKQPPSLVAITIFEALYGIESSIVKTSISDEDAKMYSDRMGKLTEACVILPFDQNAAAIAAYVFARLSKADRNKHWRDVFVVATALAFGHGIATQNRRDFELIAGRLPANYPLLRLASWKP